MPPGADITGRGLLDVDITFFAYLKSVMQRTTGASEAEVQAAVRAHARHLGDGDPHRAMEYRTAMHAQSARDWPPAASHDFALELDKPWAPSDAGLAYWQDLPRAVRESYMRQGALVLEAVMQGLAAGPR